jgi:hypothetical protein
VTLVLRIPIAHRSSSLPTIIYPHFTDHTKQNQPTINNRQRRQPLGQPRTSLNRDSRHPTPRTVDQRFYSTDANQSRDLIALTVTDGILFQIGTCGRVRCGRLRMGQILFVVSSVNKYCQYSSGLFICFRRSQLVSVCSLAVKSFVTSWLHLQLPHP